jgi:hypothetical protein
MMIDRSLRGRHRFLGEECNSIAYNLFSGPESPQALKK